jgi:HAMP domain-containing protein
MRISYKVWLVGGIPILIAAAIAIASWFLLKEAERTRNGVLLASTVYRNLAAAISARDAYVQALPGGRAEHSVRFGSLAEEVRRQLAALAQTTRDPAHGDAAAKVRDSLARYEQRMRQFMVVTNNNDHLAAEMRSRVSSLIELTDRARERQRASNADIVASLRQKDRKQRAVRNIVDKAQEVHAQLATISLQELQRNYGATWDAISAADAKRRLGLNQLRVAAGELARMLEAENRKDAAGQLLALVRTYEFLVSDPGNPNIAEPDEGPKRAQAGQQLSDWTDRLVKIYATEERSLHEEIAQLLTYSVQANETERAAQSIVIETLKLGQRTSDALAGRDPGAAVAILEASKELTKTVDQLPISPLIQTEMIDALAQWRARLATAAGGLQTQNEMIADMDQTGTEMVASARSLNDMFADAARRIGNFILTILALGATTGLLIGSGTAFVVARSITRPLQTLQQDMVALAGNPLAGPIHVSQRRDELGEMARAANFFVTEIGRREQALLAAKEQADAAPS